MLELSTSDATASPSRSLTLASHLDICTYHPCSSNTPLIACHASCTGFIVMTANATVWRADYYTLGSTYSQCTVTQRADKSAPPVYGPNCALGEPNACCNAEGSASCY